MRSQLAAPNRVPSEATHVMSCTHTEGPILKCGFLPCINDSSLMASHKPGVTVPSVTVPNLVGSLRLHLKQHGYPNDHIETAIMSINLQKPGLTLRQASSDCCKIIEQLAQERLDRDNRVRVGMASGAQNPTPSYKDKIAAPARELRATLKEMGYTDMQIDAAVTKGYNDLHSCAQYLLSIEAVAQVSSSSHSSIQAVAAAIGAIISPDGEQLEYKGWLYRTAHKRKVDQIQPQEDGRVDVVVPSDWQISTFNPEVSLICRRFPWGSHALVLNDGSSCFTTACTTSLGAPGEQYGRHYLTKIYSKADIVVRSAKATFDILLQRQVSLAAGAVAAGVAAADVKVTKSVPNPSIVSIHANPSHSINAETIASELKKRGWADELVKAAIFHVHQRFGTISLPECTHYLQHNFSGLMIAQPSAQTSSNPALVGVMLSLGCQKPHIEAAIRAGCRDENSCMDYIAKHHREASPPRAAESNTFDPPSVRLKTVHALLCTGATLESDAAAFQKFFPTRQELDKFAEHYAVPDADVVQKLYYVHARCGLQAALHLCHPSFASDDDLMIIAAQNSIRTEVLAPLDGKGWDTSATFRALWAGDRDCAMPTLTRELIEGVALTEHPYTSIQLLPFAFPLVYADTLATYIACKGAFYDAANVEAQEVLELLRAENGPTFIHLSRLADDPASNRGDCLYSSQLDNALSEARSLQTQKSSSHMCKKHFLTAQNRRRHRCLCVCGVHLALQSRKWLHERVDASANNPFQHDIDKLVCVAISVKPIIGEFLESLFEHPTYRMPSSPVSSAPELEIFYSDFASLIQQEDPRVRQMLAAHFDTHLKWILDAASGAISLAQSMLLDASSPDPFVRVLIDRAACLKSPLLAATQMGTLVSLGSLHQEKEIIKEQISDFVGLGPALNSFWSTSPQAHEWPSSHKARVNATLARTSCKSARWLLAVERAWSQKLHDIQVQIQKIPEATNPRTVYPIVCWSIHEQQNLMARVAKLLKKPSKSSDASSVKLVEGTYQDEIGFFYSVAIPRLAEAGFNHIPRFMEELRGFVSRNPSQSDDSPIHRVNVNILNPASAEWITAFKRLWLNTAF